MPNSFLPRYKYCLNMKSSREFAKHTNIGKLIEHTLQTVPTNIDDIIEQIFLTFLSMEKAWCWTFLQKIRIKPNSQHSNALLPNDVAGSTYTEVI